MTSGRDRNDIKVQSAAEHCKELEIDENIIDKVET